MFQISEAPFGFNFTIADIKPYPYEEADVNHNPCDIFTDEELWQKRAKGYVTHPCTTASGHLLHDYVRVTSM
jgi:hypothetical protein